MKRMFYYVHTGHRVGLDRFRRASALMEHWQDLDITLLTNDFRIAAACKQYHFKKGVGIDVIQNLPQIARRFDALIYDSNEHNPTIYEEMKRFFTPFIEIAPDAIAVDLVFEQRCEKKDNVVLFFGDDDYEKDLLTLAKASQLDEVEILLGYYHMLDIGHELAPLCKEVLETEEYIDAIKMAGLLITCSFQAALEGCITGAKVVYLQRLDYDENYGIFLKNFDIEVLPMQTITKNNIEKWKESISPKTIVNSAKSLADELKNSLLA